MLAQLLGMGRAKKDKDKDKDKEMTTVTGDKSKESETEEPAKGDRISSPAAGAGQQSNPPNGAVQSGNTITTAPFQHRNGSLATSSLVNSSKMRVPNGQAQHSQQQNRQQVPRPAVVEDDLDIGCECCGRTLLDCDDDELDTVVDGDDDEDYDSAGDWDHETTRSMVPSPPAAPAGAACSAAHTSAMVHPLGAKAFSAEVAAIERGLHIQLGEVGAKTEAQLGQVQLDSAKRLRYLLAANRERIIQELLARGWVPLLLRWLGLVHRPNMQVEALWALTNVAQKTTEHTPLLLKHGAVSTLVSLLKSPSLEVVEQAMWVLGIMAQEEQDGTAARDSVLQAGALGPLVRCMEQHPTLLSLQRIGAWCLCNLFDGQPRPAVDSSTVSTVMPAINRLLRCGDTKVLSHACSALSHLCDGSAAHIKVVVESGVCRRLVQLLDHHSWRVVKPALRTIGNVVCAEDDADYTEAILEAGSVACLKKLIAHPNREIQKEACWTLSNIAAGSVGQIQSVLDSGAMPQLIELATSADTESEVRSEAFWVVLNAASCGSDAQIEYLVSQGCVQILSDLLGESSMVMMALEGIERVLSVGDLRVVRNAIASHMHTEEGTVDGYDDSGAHCAECASVAAVGAAAAAAVASSGAGGGEGFEADGSDGAFANPYACLLAPEKIQALESHKNSAIAKRANRVWARYFVTCAICRQSFSRDGSSATFCTECKCHICGSCDCTVFHLDYQDKLWQEMEGNEKKGKQAQQAAKKNKKAKKREKKKLALTREPAGRDPPPSKRGGGKKRVAKSDGSRDVNGRSMSAKDVTEGGNEDGVTMRQLSRGRVEKAERGQSPSGEKGRKKESHSSSASTESNSEDEYSPSSPPLKMELNSKAARSVKANTSAAAAIINATAAAVTAAVRATSSVKNSAQFVGPAPVKVEINSNVAVAAEPPTSALGTNGASDGPDSRPSGSPDPDENQQRKRGATGESRQGRKDAGGNTKAVVGRGGGSKSRGDVASDVESTVHDKASGTNERSNDDDSEEPWVVVGVKSGSGTGPTGTKLGKRKTGQRERDAHVVGGVPVTAAVAVAPPGGELRSSVFERASESRPATVASPVTPTAVAVNKVPPANNCSLGAPGAVAGGKGTGTVGSAPSVVVGPVKGGSPWGISPATAAKATPSQPRAISRSSSPKLPAANDNRLRAATSAWTNGTATTKAETTNNIQSKALQPAPSPANGAQRCPQMPGPGQGSVWGTSPPPPRSVGLPTMTGGLDRKSAKPFATMQVTGASSNPASSVIGTKEESPLSQPPEGGAGPPSRAAGVIGPPQSSATTGTVSAVAPLPPGVATAFTPLGSSALLPSAPQRPTQSPLAASANRISTPPTPPVGVVGSNARIVGGEGGERVLDSSHGVAPMDGNSGIGFRLIAGKSSLLSSLSPSSKQQPQQQPQQQQQAGGIINGGPISIGKNTRGGGADGEALVENERLVSFLMETGSILALAQRLEEEEEWRLTPTSSGPR